MSRPFVVGEVDHVVVRCHDLAGTLEFYTRVIGLVEERRLEAIGLVQLRAGRSLVDLVASDVASSRDAPNMDHFCLGIETADLDAVVRHLDACGVERIGDPMPRYGARGMGLSLYLRDPEGNVVELKCGPESLGG